MTVDRVETWVRRAGGLATVAFMVVVYAGLWRGLGQERGRKSGPAPDGMRTLRFYAPASVVGVALAWSMWRPLRWTFSEGARVALLIVGAPLFFLGLAIMFWGRFTLGRNYDVTTALGAQLYAGHELVTEGPFAVARHPMYVGGVLWATGSALVYRTWLTVLIALTLPISLLMRARREEEALVGEFGEAYEAYRERVPGYVPWRMIRRVGSVD